MNIYEFINNHLILSIGLILSFFLLIINELKIKQQHIASIDPFKAVKLINSGAKIIDIRNPEAFKHGHIVNSKNITQDQVNAKQGNLKSQTTIIICDTGQSSSKLVNSLRLSGTENIFGISGGILGWTEANMPLVTKKK